MKAIVTGMIATFPVGGVVWDYGQYALGLEQLGFDVFYLEDTGGMTYDPRSRDYTEDPAYGVDFLERSLAFLSGSLGRRWHFRSMDGRTYGIAAPEFANLVAQADVFVNVSGGTLLRDEYLACPRKVLIDTDPGWNHFRNYPLLDANPSWGGGHGYRAHDWFFTYAERIGAADCPLPAMGLVWNPTRPPVVTGAWRPEPPAARWTTVMTWKPWKNFPGVIEHAGVTYGSKEIEFARIESLPALVDAKLEIAAGGIGPPEGGVHATTGIPIRSGWERLGWSVVDSHRVSTTAEIYRHYIQQSRGEFSVAKNVYVATRSGWFSCRSVCYLAAGRPVVVQDTGFGELLPCGEGLIAFSSLEEAAAGIERVERDYARHARAARRIAEEHFSATRVLEDMLGRIGLGGGG